MPLCCTHMKLMWAARTSRSEPLRPPNRGINTVTSVPLSGALATGNCFAQFLNVLRALVGTNAHTCRFCRLEWLEQAIANEFCSHSVTSISDDDASSVSMLVDMKPDTPL